MNDPRDGQVALLMHACHAPEGCACNGRAMVAIFTADDGFALLLAFDVPIAAHHAQDGVIRF